MVEVKKMDRMILYRIKSLTALLTWVSLEKRERDDRRRHRLFLSDPQGAVKGSKGRGLLLLWLSILNRSGLPCLPFPSSRFWPTQLNNSELVFTFMVDKRPAHGA